MTRLSTKNPQTGDGDGTGVHLPKARSAAERILISATKLFSRFGYNGVSTRDIASTAQVNEVTIYRHYPRKLNLYIAVLESELQQLRFRGDLLALVAKAPDGRAALVRSFELLSDTLLQKPDVLRLLQFSALEMKESFDPLLRKYLGELIEVVARYLVDPEKPIKHG